MMVPDFQVRSNSQISDFVVKGSRANPFLLIGSNIQSSPPHMAFSPSHGPSNSLSSLQQSVPASISRLRTSSSAFPPGLDLRNQYRAQPPQLNSPHGPATTRSNSFSAFTGGYASAPLTAPVDFALPRTPADGGSGNRDFNIPQLSAPMAPPPDFSAAYNSSLSPGRAQHGDRDFGHQSQNNGDHAAHTPQGPQGQGSRQTGGEPQQQQQQQARNNEEASYLRPMQYETGQKRKRSFTMPGSFENA